MVSKANLNINGAAIRRGLVVAKGTVNVNGAAIR